MKKIISLVLALIMIMSVAVVGFSAMAADDDVAIVEAVEGEVTEENEEEHRNFYQIFWDFCVEIYEFFRYIFYGIYIGEPA